MQHSHHSPDVQSASASGTPIPREAVPLHEPLSACADGACDEQEWLLLSTAWATSPDLRQRWADYHLIGEALRGSVTPVRSASDDFLAGVMARLQDEPVPMPPLEPAAVQAVRAPTAAGAANDGVYRWKWLAGCASVVALSAWLWQGMGALSPAPSPQLAQSSPQLDAVQVVVMPSGAMVLRDAQLDELMAAHRQWGGMSALQMPAGFLRNATYESPSR
jgi:sigma-E factor negative regulatory protein RseA